MGYDLKPKNGQLGMFHFGAFSWTHLLEQCCYLFPYANGGGRWFYVSGVDPRFKNEHKYPLIQSNDGFEVTDEEAKIMARIAKNYAIVQKHLDDSYFHQPDKPHYMQPFPLKIREDWVKKFEEFANWAESSGGFEVW